MSYDSIYKACEIFYKYAHGLEKPYYIDKSPIHGEGVFTQQFIPRGSKIGVVITFTQDGLDVTPLGSKINHQTNCNCTLQKDKIYYAVALEDLLPNTEITIDYKDTPWFISHDTEGFVEL